MDRTLKCDHVLLPVFQTKSNRFQSRFLRSGQTQKNRTRDWVSAKLRSAGTIGSWRLKMVRTGARIYLPRVLVMQAEPGRGSRLLQSVRNSQYQGPVSRTSRKRFGPEEPFQKPWSLLCTELFMSTGFVFKQSLHLYSVSHLAIFLVFQLRTFKVGFSGPKPFRDFRETGPRIVDFSYFVCEASKSWLLTGSSGVATKLLTLIADGRQ